MVIKIDVDGVIRDIVGKMCEHYNKEFTSNDVSKFIHPKDVVDYDIDKSFPLINEQYPLLTPSGFFFKIDWMSEMIFKNSEVFEGVVEAINKLHEHGHKVVIVSWQFGNNMIHTINYLRKHNIHFDDICFTKDKWMINGDYLIDDNTEFILDERDTSKKIIIDRPYNQNVNDDKITRCKSLLEAVHYIIDNNN